jgi:hypothetical protein
MRDMGENAFRDLCKHHDYYNDLHGMTFFEQRYLVPFVNMLVLLMVLVMNKTTISNLPQ